MAEWRFARGWDETELRERLERLRGTSFNFEGDEPGWTRYYSEAPIAREEPGPPMEGGAFERAWLAVQRYEFSDPGIVVAHFDPQSPMLGRDLLLELKVLGLRYLCGTRVERLREKEIGGFTIRGFRYDTLAGHLEQGAEWFLLTKRPDGEIWFRIHASWRMGEFPNWWSRLGFRLVGRHYQLAWHRLAYERLRKAVNEPIGLSASRLPELPDDTRLFHSDQGPIDPELWSFGALKTPGEVLEGPLANASDAPMVAEAATQSIGLPRL